MKRLLGGFLLGLITLLGFSCNKKPISLPYERDTVAQQISQLAKTSISPKIGDSLINAWKHLIENPIVKKDTVLAVKVNYNLARIYGMMERDSARFFVEQALELIEPTAGNLEDKALVYNGVGNIRSLEAKRHEANYYYSKAATIVMSDSTIDLSPEAKSAMLLSASQSSRMNFQYDLAEKMNRAALPFTNLLPEGHINRQRVLVQMIQMMNLQRKSPDSVAPYLYKLEELHRLHPDKYNVSFLYESKIKYFELTTQKDSLLHYQLLKAKIDESRYNVGLSNVTEINNLFINYCNIAGTYVLFERAKKAAETFQKATLLMTKYKDLIYSDNKIIYQNNLAALYALQGKKDQAIDLLFKTYDLQKAVYQTENTQVVAEMNSLYQLQAKDRSIRTLNENIKINQLQLQQNRLWLLVFGLAAVLLGLTSMFLYHSFRQRRMQQEKEKILLQQQLLRTQMEPHFIFNTLSAVQSFVRLDKKESAIKYLNRFSRLLRSSLELSRENLVPLNEEIETLENYLSLQQMRFESAFSYCIEYPQEQDWDAVMIPPMLIQPYVENAILHGVDLNSGRGNIDIIFRLEADMLQVSIIDSGKTATNQADFSHRSLSGTISRERLHLLGKKASVTSTMTAEGGTTVRLHIPVVYG